MFATLYMEENGKGQMDRKEEHGRERSERVLEEGPEKVHSLEESIREKESTRCGRKYKRKRK